MNLCYKYYFIFEDDVELVPEINRTHFLAQLNTDIRKISKTKTLSNMMYLGACLEQIIVNNPDTDYNNISCWGAHAYVINKEGIKQIFNNVLCWHQYPDYILKSHFNTNIFGHQYYYKYDRGHLGYFFQGRQESWYTNGIAEGV